MSVLKDIGIQQWRLKPSYGEAPISIEEKMLVDSVEEQTQLSQNEVAISDALQAELRNEVAIENIESENIAPQLGWQDLQALVDSNKNCPSCYSNNTVLGVGKTDADWVFIADAPTSNEVAEQQFFLGRAGELFDAMLLALGLNRDEVYVTSLFKCAPTEDLSATPQCNELVYSQIALVQPKVVVTFGEFTAQALLKANGGLNALRNAEQRCTRNGTAVIPTYTPAQMLDDASYKAAVWQDLKKAMAIVSD